MFLTETGLAKVFQRVKSFVASQLNSKASAIHTHTYSEIVDLPNGIAVDSTIDGTSSNAIANSAVSNALNGKSDTSHTHTVSDVTDFPTLATVATSGSYNDLSNKPTTMTPTSHTHGNITNDGKIGSNANKPLITTTGGTVTTSSFGTSANTFCEGNDSRLSDARTPTSHTHTVSDVTDFPNLSTVATSGSYNDLSNKPTIPTVNNATLTIQKNGSNVATFTANASSNVTCNITVPTKTSELSNDSGFLTSHQDLSGYIPRSGGVVMTSNALGRAINNNEVRLDGGTGWGQGASVVLSGKDQGYAGRIRLAPTDGSRSIVMALAPDGGWAWNGQPIQYDSDQRLKQQISKIDNALLDAWEDVEPVQFKYNDAVDQKKDKARLHTGYVVQQIDEACQKHDVDISAYGLYCHEEYPEETEEVEVTQDDGTTTKETKVIREAKEHYSLRYTETLVVECAYLRRENNRLKERLSKIEKLLNI